MLRSKILLAAFIGSASILAVSTTASGQGGDVQKTRVRAIDRHPNLRAGAEGERRQPLPPLAAVGSNPAIMLTGYWPPTNEAVRRFSPDPVQNPAGWIGQNWENRGYDVYAYFPEFTPPNCSNCGKGSGDFEVDYQDTSSDFWSIANALQPIAIMTFSRGSGSGLWEVEMNQYNRTVWFGDYMAPTQPTPAPPDASVPAGFLRPSSLPVHDIVNAVNGAGLGLNAFICFSGDGGGFLSEFIAYHGVWYRDLHQSPTDPNWCIAGGHIHVSPNISWPVARQAAQVSLRSLIQHVDSVRAATVCQPDLGSGGPGPSTLAMCGAPFLTGGLTDLRLSDAPPSSQVFLFAGGAAGAAPLGLGTFIPSAPLISIPLPTDPNGQVLLTGIQGGGGPSTAWLQAVYADGTLPGGIGLSNALKVDILP